MGCCVRPLQMGRLRVRASSTVPFLTEQAIKEELRGPTRESIAHVRADERKGPADGADDLRGRAIVDARGLNGFQVVQHSIGCMSVTRLCRVSRQSISDDGGLSGASEARRKSSGLPVRKPAAMKETSRAERQ